MYNLNVCTYSKFRRSGCKIPSNCLGQSNFLYSCVIIKTHIHTEHSTLHFTVQYVNFCLSFFYLMTKEKRRVLLTYRRRIKTEETAKVVAAVWGTELIQFLAALVIFQQDDFEEKDE